MATRRKNFKSSQNLRNSKLTQKGGGGNINADDLLQILDTNHSATLGPEIKESQILYQNAKYYYSAGEYSGALVSFACACVLLNTIIRRLREESKSNPSTTIDDTIKKAENLLNCCLISVEELQTIVRNSTSSKKDDDEKPKEWEKICVKIQPLVFKKGSSNCIFYDDVIGLQKEKDKLENSFVFPLIYPNLYPKVSKGILIYGPPGTGKTLLVKAAVNQLQERSQDVGVLYFSPSPGDLKGKYVGETEKKIEEWFNCASRKACDTERSCDGKKFISIIFIDEIDSIARDRSQDSSGLAANSVNTLLQMMDGINSKENVAIIGATNYPWDLDSAILRRFDTQILIGLPEREDMKKLLDYEVNRYLDLDMKISTVCDEPKVNVNATEQLNNNNADKCGLLCDHNKQIKNINKPFYKKFKIDYYEDLKKEKGGSNDLSQVSGIIAMLKEKNFTNSDISRFVKAAARRAGELSVACNLFYNTSSIGHITENKEDMYMSSLTKIQDETLAINTSIEILNSFRQDMENAQIFQISPPEISVIVFDGYYYYNIKCILYKNVDMVFNFPLLKNLFIKGQAINTRLTPEIYKTNILNQYITVQNTVVQGAKNLATGVADRAKPVLGAVSTKGVATATAAVVAGLTYAEVLPAAVVANVAVGAPAVAAAASTVASEFDKTIDKFHPTDIIMSFDVNFENTGTPTAGAATGVLPFPSQAVNCFYSSLFDIIQANNPTIIYSSQKIPEITNNSLTIDDKTIDIKTTLNENTFKIKIKEKFYDNVPLTLCNFDFFSFSLLDLISSNKSKPYTKITKYVTNLQAIGKIEPSTVNVAEYTNPNVYASLKYKILKSNEIIQVYFDNATDYYINFNNYKKLIDNYFIYNLLFPNIVTGIDDNTYIKIDANFFNLLFSKQISLPTYINTNPELDTDGILAQVYLNSALKLFINYSKDDKYMIFSQCLLVKFLEYFLNDTQSGKAAPSVQDINDIFSKICNSTEVKKKYLQHLLLDPATTIKSNPNITQVEAAIKEIEDIEKAEKEMEGIPQGYAAIKTELEAVQDAEGELTTATTAWDAALSTEQKSNSVKYTNYKTAEAAVKAAKQAAVDLESAVAAVAAAEAALATAAKTEYETWKNAIKTGIGNAQAEKTLQTAAQAEMNAYTAAQTAEAAAKAKAGKSTATAEAELKAAGKILANTEYDALEAATLALTEAKDELKTKNNSNLDVKDITKVLEYATKEEKFKTFKGPAIPTQTTIAISPKVIQNNDTIYTSIFKIILQEKYLIQTGYMYHLGVPTPATTPPQPNIYTNKEIITTPASFDASFNSIFDPVYNLTSKTPPAANVATNNKTLYTFYREQLNLTQKLDDIDVNTKEIFLATKFNFNAIYELKKPNLISSVSDTLKGGYNMFKGMLIEEPTMSPEAQKSMDSAKLMNDLIEHNQLISVLFKEIKAFGFLFSDDQIEIPQKADPKKNNRNVISDTKEFKNIVWQNIELSVLAKIADDIRSGLIDPSPELIELAILDYLGTDVIGASKNLVGEAASLSAQAANYADLAAKGVAGTIVARDLTRIAGNSGGLKEVVGAGAGILGAADAAAASKLGAAAEIAKAAADVAATNATNAEAVKAAAIAAAAGAGADLAISDAVVTATAAATAAAADLANATTAAAAAATAAESAGWFGGGYFLSGALNMAGRAAKAVLPGFVAEALFVAAPMVAYGYLGAVATSNVYKCFTNKKENIDSNYIINNTFIMTLLNIITTIGKFSIDFKGNMLTEVHNAINNIIYTNMSAISYLISYSDPKSWSSSAIGTVTGKGVTTMTRGYALPGEYPAVEIKRYTKGQKTQKKNIGYSLYNINIPLQAFHYAFLEVKSSYNSQLGTDLIAYNQNRDKFLAEKAEKDKKKK